MPPAIQPSATPVPAKAFQPSVDPALIAVDPAVIAFTKMHGIGNDYVYVDGAAQRIDHPAELAVSIADRHRGVGGDGLILILPPEPGVGADVRMRMFNADGSESEMCGNGVRCVAKYAIDHGLSAARPIRVQTGRGVLSIDWARGADGRVAEASVDMGAPILALPDVPVDASKLRQLEAVGSAERAGQGTAALIELPADSAGGSSAAVFRAIFVSMGNPHAVIFVDDVATLDLLRFGPRLERHPAFPRRMNIHVVQVHSTSEVTMRTWERGSGITQACGTGASAVCVAGVLDGRTGREILAHLPGGDLRLAWRDDGHVVMTGPATEVFSGNWIHGTRGT